MRRILILLVTISSLFVLLGCIGEEKDVVPPTIHGAKDITYYIGRPQPNYMTGVTASDHIDGDLTDMILVDDSLVDLTSPGFYDLFYRVKDLSGNETVVKISVIFIKLSTR